MDRESAGSESKEAAKQTGMDPVILGSAVSVLLSWYYFYARDDRQQGLFVGLWAPTLIAFDSYFRQTEMYEMLKHGSSGVMNRVERELQE